VVLGELLEQTPSASQANLFFLIVQCHHPSNKFIMSDWKASTPDLKKLHTDSNLKTNTSFEFGQASHMDFPSPHPILLHEE
jgi:hypothetical protein